MASVIGNLIAKLMCESIISSFLISYSIAFRIMLRGFEMTNGYRKTNYFLSPSNNPVFELRNFRIANWVSAFNPAEGSLQLYLVTNSKNASFEIVS